MCQVLLPAEPSSSCGQCGADLSRWVKKSEEPQTAPTRIDLLQEESWRSARNGLYSLAAVWAIPFLLATAAVIAGHESPDSIQVTFIAVPALLCALSIIAAIKFAAGKKIGKLWAFLPVWVLMSCFPIGTLVAYTVHSRLGEAELE